MDYLDGSVANMACHKGRPVACTLMIKPRGPTCNLDCTYCYYKKKGELYPTVTQFRMSDDLLEEFTRQYINGQEASEVTFVWQGGEPALMGLDFFRKAVALQEKYRRPGMQVYNAFQTNGTLLDKDWCRFFHDHRFLVGLSLDGPEWLHDRYRLDRAGKPTFRKVLHGLDLLQEHNVEFNVLCVVSRANGNHPLEVYEFFKGKGIRFIQFIPAVHCLRGGGPTMWTVRPEQYGRFLCTVFDRWVRRDVGRVFVQIFDVALRAWLGLEPSLCIFATRCGSGLVLEHNGDVYSCDHFVLPGNFLGNIRKIPLAELVRLPVQREFGTAKRSKLPQHCRDCPVVFTCNGGCPKDRFIKTPDGELGLNYLCAGYRKFFTHIDPYMRFMAAEVRAGRPASNIMALLKQPIFPTLARAAPGISRARLFLQRA